MRLLFNSILTLLIFSSCISRSELKTIFPTPYLDGNSAKVWVLEKSSLENDEALTLVKEYRKSFIFFSNNTFREQEFIHLGSQQGKIGTYKIYVDQQQESSTLALTYKSHSSQLYFDVIFINTSTLILKNSESSVVWEFRSLKPPL